MLRESAGWEKSFLFDVFMQLCIEELLYRMELYALFVLVYSCLTNINWPNLVNVCLAHLTPMYTPPTIFIPEE